MKQVVNRQLRRSNVAVMATVMFGACMSLPFLQDNPFTGLWAVAFLSFFLAVSSVIFAIFYRIRSGYFEQSVASENILARWDLTEAQRLDYAKAMFDKLKRTHRSSLVMVSVMVVIIFGIFMFALDEDDRKVLIVIMVGYLLLFLLVAFLDPLFRRLRNMKGDGVVLIGKDFIYINGEFHYWGHRASSIADAQIIHDPFYGIRVIYGYTLKSVWTRAEMDIPAPEGFDLQGVRKRLLDGACGPNVLI